MPNNKVAVITGSSSGLGLAIANTMLDQGWFIKGLDLARAAIRHERYIHYRCDITMTIPSFPKLDVLINCAGINKIGWLEDFSYLDYLDVMMVNADAIFRLTQHYLPQLIESKGTVLNIVSDAARKPMRCSAAYNASKAAALMLTKQMARELFPRYGITVFSVSPNKLSGTGMSREIDRQVVQTRGWTEEQARAYQLQGLSVGKETPPELVADFIAFLLSTRQRHFHLNGCDMQYGD